MLSQKNLPMDPPFLGHRCPIFWHLCLLIQLNSLPMDDSYVFSKNWFQYSSFQLMIVEFWTNVSRRKMARYSTILGCSCTIGQQTGYRRNCTLKTCSSPRHPLFLNALSFECTSKPCINFISQFSFYIYI